MHLSDYMAKHGLSDDDMVERVAKIARVKISRPTISRIRRRIIARPEWETMCALNDATDGKVTPNDFLEVA